jgi:hypothetical protein
VTDPDLPIDATRFASGVLLAIAMCQSAAWAKVGRNRTRSGLSGVFVPDTAPAIGGKAIKGAIAHNRISHNSQSQTMMSRD